MTFYFSKRGSSVKPEACGSGKWVEIGIGLFWARAWISMAGNQATHHEYC